MNLEEQNYLNLLRKILDEGSVRKDRTGIGTKSIFGSQLKFSLEDNKIPILTSKKIFIKGVIEELLFFLRGDTNTKNLEAKGVNIWKGNTTREFLDKRGLSYLPEGDMGKGYGFQWRNFGGNSNDGIDQLANIINTIKNDPTDRRIILSAWNPSQLSEMALAPCHIFCQFYVDDGKLSSQFYMRSVDTFLGLPFNLLSYAMLTRIIATATNLESKELIFIGGDTHCYLNHISQVEEQITREPYDFPNLYINKQISTIQDIENLSFEDFKIENYIHHPAIKGAMAI